jgi:phosphoglycolate phosphatase-like HAD superfamily hydrolase
MRFDAVVFDFDGCLVDSVQAKYNAFFDVFPSGAAHRRVVADVLCADPDGSRHNVIPRMAESMRRAGLALDDRLSDEERIVAYGGAVLEAVAACPARPRAEDLLRHARRTGSVYISSNTPEVPLRELVRRRGWLPLVDAVYGYPRRKEDTLRQIVTNLGGRGDSVLVVGDGVSDEAAARDNGCVFVWIDARSGLAPAFAALETSRVQK